MLCRALLSGWLWEERETQIELILNSKFPPPFLVQNFLSLRNISHLPPSPRELKKEPQGVWNPWKGDPHYGKFLIVEILTERQKLNIQTRGAQFKALQHSSFPSHWANVRSPDSSRESPHCGSQHYSHGFSCKLEQHWCGPGL